MKLEDYFDQLASDDIRIKGTRIGIESVLYEYIYREQSPEAIQTRFSSLTLEQIYATILYYLHEKEKITDYMKDWILYSQSVRVRQQKNPPPVVIRLLALKKKYQQATAIQ